MENVDEIWSELTVESARFILEQSEKTVNATIETARLLTNSAVNVLQFSIPLSLAVIGLLIGDSRKPRDFLAAALPSKKEHQYLAVMFRVIRGIEITIEKNNKSNLERQRVLFWTLSLLKFLIAFSVVYIPVGLLLVLFPGSF